MNSNRRRFLEAIGVASIGGLAGCRGFPGGGSDETPDGTDRPTVSPTATLTPTQTAAPTATPEPTPMPTPAGTVDGKIAAANGDTDDTFGRAVAVSADGSTVLVGAPGDEDPHGDGPFSGDQAAEAGSAYVFERSGDGWVRRANFGADDADSEDRFGTSVAVSDDGTVAVVGAVGDEDPNGVDAGSAYVFELTDGAWRQQTKLTAAAGDVNDEFGRSVALSGDGTTAIVGAPQQEVDGVAVGTVLVFERAGGDWSQQSRLTADDGNGSDEFGWSVALSDDGSTALVGAPGEDTPEVDAVGSAYVFERANGSWGQQAKLATPDDGSPVDFGSAIALSADGSAALVGDSGADSVNVYGRADGTWSERAELAADDGDSSDFFGGSVAVSDDGETALVGAAGDEDPHGSGAGSAYRFERASGEWSQQAKLTAPEGDSDDSFGVAVAMSGDGATALVGADSDEDPHGRDAGSVYVFD